MAIVSVLALGILVFVHELGHFLVAKYYKIGVLEFAIGLGPKIITKRIGETRYSIRLIPIGGFVQMVGDTPDQLIDAKNTLKGKKKNIEIDPIEQKLIADKSRWFLLQPLRVRSAVVLAGPFFNIIFAFILSLATFYTYGTFKVVDDPIIGEVIPDLPAEKGGVLIGDRILSVNGDPVVVWKDIRGFIVKAGEGDIDLTVQRKDPTTGEMKEITIPLRSKNAGAEVDYLTGSGEGKHRLMIGISQRVEREPTTITKSVTHAAYLVSGVTWITIKSIVGFLNGIISTQNLGGPIMIFKEASKSAKKGAEALSDFIVFFSVSLAVLNLLPMPVLDGGHLLFFLIEAIRGKPLSFRVYDYATRVGMALLLMLMIYALRNDLHRMLT